MCFFAICLSSLEKYLFRYSTYFLIVFVCVCMCERERERERHRAAWAFCIFLRLIPCWLLHLQIFSPILRLSFCFVYGFLAG